MASVLVVTLFSCLLLFAHAQSEWLLTGNASPQDTVSLTVAVKQQNLAQLEQIFWEVSTPSSPQYGKFLTAAEVSALVMPSQESINSVVNWLTSYGVQHKSLEFTRSMDFIKFSVPISIATELLSTKYVTYKHTTKGTVLIKAAGEYKIPAHLKNHIDFVAGHIGFPLPSRPIYVSASSDAQVNPTALRTRYNVTANLVGTAANNSYAVAEFQAQYYSPTDLKMFFQDAVPFYPNGYNIDHVVGGNTASAPGVEASLDIQYIMGVAPGITSWFWSNPETDFFTDMVNWLAQIDNTPDAPLVHSVSYGSQSQLPSGAIHDRVDVEFQKIGARGVSIIFASGDYGTGCILCVEFRPSWPASSQYVTSVGATRFIDGVSGAEMAVNEFGSGGGFSSKDNQPSYQTAAVNNYFKVQSDLPAAHFYNKTGRGTPDVAALGIGFLVYVNGAINTVGGTSASSPTFAAIISLLNDQRLNAGKSSLGFLNPWLYQTQASRPDAFFDVTQGDNQHGCCGLTGFKCAPGWDPVTGLGTPNFAVLSTLV